MLAKLKSRRSHYLLLPHGHFQPQPLQLSLRFTCFRWRVVGSGRDERTTMGKVVAKRRFAPPRRNASNDGTTTIALNVAETAATQEPQRTVLDAHGQVFAESPRALFPPRRANAQCYYQTICAWYISFSRTSTLPNLTSFCILHSHFTTWNASLVMCLQSCAIGCALKTTCAQCKISLEGTLILSCRKIIFLY